MFIRISVVKQHLRMQGGLCMERKFEIPEMSNEEIARWYATIKPIVLHDTYLRELSAEELTNTAYTWLNEPTDYADKVDFTKLSVLEDRKMLHGWGYYGFFKPSVGEVIRQIPKEYLEKVVAFEIIDGAIAMNSTFKEELNAGFHVSIVRLYQPKDDTNEAAHPITRYPVSDSKTPVGITEEEFKELFPLENY